MSTFDGTTFKPIEYGYYEPFEWVKLRHGTATWLIFGGGRPQTEEEAQHYHEYNTSRFPAASVPDRPRTKKQMSLSVPMIKPFMSWVRQHKEVTHLLLLCNHNGRIPTMMVQRLRSFPERQRFQVVTYDGHALRLQEDSPREFSTIRTDSHVYRTRRSVSAGASLRFDRPVDLDGVKLTLDMVQDRQRQAALGSQGDCK